MDLLHLPERDRWKNIYVLLQINSSKFLQSKITAIVQNAKKTQNLFPNRPNGHQILFLNLLLPNFEFWAKYKLQPSVLFKVQQHWNTQDKILFPICQLHLRDYLLTSL